MKKYIPLIREKVLALVLTVAALAVGQTAWAETVTYTVTGGNNSQTEFYAQFTDGSSTSNQVTWTYNSTSEISFNLRTNLTLTLTNSGKQLGYRDGLIGGQGSTTLTVSSSTYYIYRVRLLDASGNVIWLDANGDAVSQGGVSECDYWNMTKSFSPTYSGGILFSKIEVSYDTAIPITGAVITGLNSQYPVSNAAVKPTPTVTWHGTTLTKGTHYSLTYQNNTAVGTATVMANGTGIFASNTSASANYTLVWATYSVRFNKNNDAATGTMANQDFTYNTAQPLTANAFTRTGYTFAGWNTAANGSGTSYADGQSVSNLTATNGGTVDLYAQWTDVWGMADGADGSEAHPYVITTTAGLDLLAKNVNGTDGYTANDFSDTYFKLGDDISYTHITDWNDAASMEDNYTAIGGRINDSNRYFRGTFDGQGHTVSGIRIYKGGTTDADSYQGLFGMTRGATIRNVILADARITGKQEVGGIAGYNEINGSNVGIVENCRVGSDVTIHAVANNAYSHGGVVGDCNGGTISGCVSAATLTVADDLTGIDTYGGIVGSLNGDMSDCLAVGASVPAVNKNGAIAGYVYSGSTQNTYYHGCTVGNAAPQSDAYTVSAGTGVTLTHAGSPDQAYPHGGIQRYGSILCYGGVLYAPAGADVSLSITVPTGFILEGYTASAGTISGNVLTMPAQDVTINATLTDVWNITAGNDGSSAEKAYVITTTAGLDLLAKYVNGTDGYTANDFSDTYFVLGDDISYTHTTDWNDAASMEDNYTAIGGYIDGNWRYFRGTFDGQGHTVSGIRIYKGGTTDADSYQGLFGMTRGATIRNVILADARITGKQYVGGIAGYIAQNAGNGGIVENCRVGSDVAIHAVVDYAYNHGGVVGQCNNGGTIRGCVSAATLTVADGLTTINTYGGIVGNLNGNMSDCLAIGASVPAVNSIGAIAGYVNSGSTQNTYYHGCTVGNAANQSDAYTVSAGTGVTLTHAGSPDQAYPHGGIQRYGSILCYGGVLYAPAGATVTLGTVTGYMLSNVTVSGTNTLEADGDGSIKIDPLTGDTISKTDDNPTPGVMRYHPVSPNVIQVLEDTDGDGVPDTWVDYPLVWEDIDDDGLLEGGIDRDGDGNIDDVDGDNLTQQQPGGDTDKDPTDGNPNNPKGKDVILLHVDTDGDNDVDDEDEWVQLQKDLSTGVISPVYEEKITATDNGDGTWSFNMPDQNVTVAATVTVAYIDADGTEQSCTNYTLLTTDYDISNAMDQGYLPGGWYVVNGEIQCDYLQFSGDVHIILADGARLEVGNYIDSNGYDLTIYGQAAGSGELTVIYWDFSIYCNNICINGGTINIVSSNNYGIQANGNVTINGGTINIESLNNYGILANGNVTINGGTINNESINNYGIQAYGNVTINGGTINNSGSLVYQINASNVILANSTSLKTLNITRDIYVNRISLDRTFTKGKPATVMLPFSMEVNAISGGTFYTFGGVEKENDRWVATMNAVTGSIEANTPYIVMPTETSLTFNNGTYLCTEGGGGGQTADEGSHWTFKGTYDYIKWTTDTSDPDYTAGRAAEIGRVYGFAGVAKSENSIEVGDFVKVASGARIRPMSAYLMWSDTPNQAPARTGMKAAADTADELPQSITVRLIDASGTVTNVGEIDTETGEISFVGWYTLQGVKLDAEPTEPGIYIYNGKTVSIQK